MSWFNEEQQGHMRHLASLPPEKKCGCGWYVKGDCVDCNTKELIARGGRHEWKNAPTRVGRSLPDAYVLPDGTRADYIELCAWLRSN